MNFNAVKLFFCAVVLGVLVARIPAAREFALHPLDVRPVATVLFISDNRTDQKSMQDMLNAIADSVRNAKKYTITIYAPNGSTMQDHWNDPKVHELLEKRWDYVVLQGQSGDQLTQEGNATFETYGHALTTLAQASGSSVLLLVDWRAAENDPAGLNDQMQYRIQDSYGQLAIKAGVQLVNVGRVWEKLRAAAPQMPLYHDANHPSIYSNYLSALMFYRYFSGDSLIHVTYVPEGLSSQDADLIRKLAQEQ